MIEEYTSLIFMEVPYSGEDMSLKQIGTEDDGLR